jgi:hypothetical protein
MMGNIQKFQNLLKQLLQFEIPDFCGESDFILQYRYSIKGYKYAIHYDSKGAKLYNGC